MARTPAFTEYPDLTALVSQFHSEEKCRAYLEQLRWPDGVRCPRCDARKGISRIESRGQFDCDSCGYQFSVRVGTIFHDSHLPLWKWFLAVYVMSQSKTGVSANQLKRLLGASYKTAWYLCHRIRAAMKDEAPDLLRGIAQAGERSVGGAASGSAIVAPDEHAVRSAFDRNGRVRRRRSQKNVIDSVWAVLTRSVLSSYHHVSPKHLPAYLDEMAFRYRNRENAYLFRDTLLRLIGADSMRYTELIASP